MWYSYYSEKTKKECIMSNSERLSQTAASIGGGKGIFNEDALGFEVGMQLQVAKLIPILQKEYPKICNTIAAVVITILSVPTLISD